MASNSKLSAQQKIDLRIFRESQLDFKVANNGVTTVVYREFKNTVEFAVSVAGPDELKFRRKVGEFYARERVDYGNTQKMLTNDFYGMLYDVLDSLEA